MQMFGTLALAAVAYQGSGAQIRDGKLQQVLEGYVQAVQASPKSVAANNGAGVMLDLLGRYAEARKYFGRAIAASATPADRAQAQRAMAISFGFARDCKGAEKADGSAFDYYLSAPDFYSAGEVADEVGRLCLDAGDFDRAYTWYRRGHEAGLQEADIPRARRDLWEFRWAHARARIAARRGKMEEARKYVAAARTILEKGSNPEQQIYLPYLTGYVAFYAGDYAAALAELQNASQADPFIQCLIGQTYEKLGDRVKALEYYGRAAAATAHSVPAAYARPFAKARLE
jgi:tetratricopeptide (TPR) repeat protein